MIFIAAAPPTPVAYVSSVHHRSSCSTLATCGIPPYDESSRETDHDYIEGHLWVQTVTGGPSEFSPVSKVSFTIPQMMPWRTLALVPDFTSAVRPQTRALGRTHLSASKMRGR
jgi:hypothetical protein